MVIRHLAELLPSMSGRTFAAAVARPLLFGVATLRHARSVHGLLTAPPGSLLRSYLAARPEIWSLLRVRFVSAGWGAARRIGEVISHCRTAEAIGRPFAIRPHEAAELIRLDEIEPGLRLVLDSARWMMREGMLSLSLQQGGDRLFTLAFILSDRSGERVAYVGGVQGRRGEDVLDRYRQLTRAACGLRPPDLLFELFRLVCQQAGVARIRAVSGRMHPPLTDADGRPLPIAFDYDRYWTERGGRPGAEGLFDLDVQPALRPLDEVPARKRAERRRRMQLIADIGARLATTFADAATIPIHAVEPAAA